jgi:glucosamine kinase
VSEFVVGIDAGGTSVRLQAATLNGVVVAEAAVAAAPDGLTGTLDELTATVLARYESSAVVGVCAGLAKITRAGVGDAWEAALRARFPAAMVACVPDYVAAFHGALPAGVGIVVIAGTGSVAYGESASGHGLRVGGRGWEYGDEGSGGWLTTELLRRLLRALDGVQPSSPLLEAAGALLGARTTAEVGEIARLRALTEGRGFLMPFALERARAGDAEAANLFVGAGGWLALLARTGLARLRFPPESAVRVATVGGMWAAEELLRTPFETVLHRSFPGARVVPAEAAPVAGAVRLAIRNLRAALPVIDTK